MKQLQPRIARGQLVVVLVVEVYGLGALRAPWRCRKRGGWVRGVSHWWKGVGRLENVQERLIPQFRHLRGEGGQFLYKSRVIVLDGGWWW